MNCRCFYCDELVAFAATLMDLSTGKIMCEACNKADADEAAE